MQPSIFLSVSIRVLSPGDDVNSPDARLDRRTFCNWLCRKTLASERSGILAAAFREISRAVPKARLLIVGSGEKLQLIQAILREEIRRGLVHLELDVPHQRLAEWYRAMDPFVMPSRYENFSNAILKLWHAVCHSLLPTWVEIGSSLQAFGTHRPIVIPPYVFGNAPGSSVQQSSR